MPRPSSRVPIQRPGRRSGRAAPEAAPPRLDPTAAGRGDDLDEEVALLRAAIRRLADLEDADAPVKQLAELRHQVQALCTALKTRRGLSGADGDGLSQALARALEQLGDELGVPR